MIARIGGRTLASCAVLVALAVGLLVGCAQPSRSGTAPAVPRPTHRIGDTVTLADGAAVTLVSVTETAPLAAHGEGALWLTLNVTNSSDVSLMLPGRPLRPRVATADGTLIDISGTSVFMTNGSTGFGLSARPRGSFLYPGAVMLAVFTMGSREATAARSRPLVVTYAPTGGQAAEFRVE